VNTTQGVGQVTLQSDHQPQPLELVGKEKKKEATPKELPTSRKAQEQSQEEANPSSLNSKG